MGINFLSKSPEFCFRKITLQTSKKLVAMITIDGRSSSYSSFWYGQMPRGGVRAARHRHIVRQGLEQPTYELANSI